jgi:hypothetical protein
MVGLIRQVGREDLGKVEARARNASMFNLCAAAKSVGKEDGVGTRRPYRRQQLMLSTRQGHVKVTFFKAKVARQPAATSDNVSRDPRLPQNTFVAVETQDGMLMTVGLNHGVAAEYRRTPAIRVFQDLCERSGLAGQGLHVVVIR